MTKAESKYFNTALKMDDAFLSLLEKKDFEYITVKEICKNAGVNRSTFYLHYETVGDLVSECIERMNDDFIAYFNSLPLDIAMDVNTSPLEKLFFITPEYVTPYLKYIAEHKKVFKIALTKPETLRTQKTYEKLFYPVISKVFDRFKVAETERGYFMAFYLGGLSGIVKRWLQNDCKDPVEQITAVIVKAVKP